MRLIFATLDTQAKITLSVLIFCAILLSLAITSYAIGKLGYGADKEAEQARAGARDLLKDLGQDPASYSDRELDEIARIQAKAKGIDVDTNT